MKSRVLLAFCLAVAACGAPPEVLPPPFGPTAGMPTRLFFPTGLATLPDGSLLVANGNFNHQYDAGTMVSIRKAYLDGFFAKKLSCQTVVAPEQALKYAPNPCDDDVSAHPGDVFGGAVLIGNYAGPIALNDAHTMAFTGARDTSIVHGVVVNPDLTLSCPPGAGTGTDCRNGVVNVGKVGVLGPYAIVPGEFAQPGEGARRVLYVSAMVPRIDQIGGGTMSTSAVVAALDMADPSQVLFTMLSASPFLANGWGAGPAVFDAARRQLVLGGCFSRFLGTGSGEPGTGRCVGIANNFLRFLDVDAQSNALVQLFDLYGDVLSIETTAMLLADPDPVTLAPTTLWATMRSPDSLAEIELPLSPSVPPRVRHVSNLPIAPAGLTLIPRTGKAPLLAAVAERNGTMVFYDTGIHQVVGQVENLGDSPFTTQLLGSDGTTAQLATSVFRGCKVALVEVPLDAPWDAELRGRVGKCP